MGHLEIGFDVESATEMLETPQGKPDLFKITGATGHFLNAAIGTVAAVNSSRPPFPDAVCRSSDADQSQSEDFRFAGIVVRNHPFSTVCPDFLSARQQPLIGTAVTHVARSSRKKNLKTIGLL